MKEIFISILLILAVSLTAVAQEPFKGPNTAIENTGTDKLYITPIAHGTVLLQYKDMVIYLDPAGRATYENMPKADLILVTHHHGDHMNASHITRLSKDGTLVYGTEMTAKFMPGTKSMKNGDTFELGTIKVTAVPAYNIVNKMGNKPFHVKGEGNGYLISFDSYVVYVAGDTEIIPEMTQLKGKVHVAFMPISPPFTMNPDECAQAAKIIKPRILYPYHQFQADPNKVKELLKDETTIEVRVLKL